tara:strand:+ start:203 stop:1027 length:825 start_codon:yes stop_codon:yes gene_type:complete
MPEELVTIGYLSEFVYETEWAHTKGEVTALRNSEEVVNHFHTDTLVSEIRPFHISEFVSSLRSKGNSPGTINRKLAALSKMLTVAYRNEWIDSRPHIPRQKEPTHRIRWITKDEERQMAVHSYPHFARLWTVLIDTGLRVGEALRLPAADVDLDQNRIHVWDTKSDKPRSIPMTKRVRDILSAGTFFNITQDQVNYQWNRMKSAMDLHDDKFFVPHICRHTFASRLVQRGVGITVVQQLCGHKTLEITLRYAHLAPSNVEDAIQMLEEDHAAAR